MCLHLARTNMSLLPAGNEEACLWSHQPITDQVWDISKNQWTLKKGEGGSPKFSFKWNPYIFGSPSKSPSKILESYDNPFLEFRNGGNSKKRIKYPLAPMGSLLPGLHTLDPPLSPPSTLMETFWRTCLGWGVKKLKQFLINFLAISGDSKHFLFLRQKNLIFFVT